MGFNPYASIADVAGLVGASGFEKAARVGDRAQRRIQTTGGRAATAVTRGTKKVGQGLNPQSNAPGFNAHPTRGAIAGRNSQSLPGIRTSNGVIGQGMPFKARYDRLGNLIKPFYIQPRGFPSVKVGLADDEGVESTVTRQSDYTAWISDSYWARLLRVTKKILSAAKSLSRGRLTLKQLAEKNHPYGHGLYPKAALRANPNATKKQLTPFRRRGLGRLTARKGVSNLAVVNYQTGDFYRAWSVDLDRRANGITLVLKNGSEVAEWLAFSTKVMRAHGPFLTAVQLHLAEFDAVWRRACRDAFDRLVRQAEATNV